MYIEYDAYITVPPKVVLVALRDPDAADVLRSMFDPSTTVEIVLFGKPVPIREYTHAFLMSEPETPEELTWWYDHFKPHLNKAKLFDLAAP